MELDALCGAGWTSVAVVGDKNMLLKKVLFSFQPHTRTPTVRLKAFLTWPATVMLLSARSLAHPLRYAAIRAFCLINNLSVMYWTLALIWFSVRCVVRKLPAPPHPPPPFFQPPPPLSPYLRLFLPPYFPPFLPPSLHKVTHASFWLCVYGCRDQDEGAILKGLQLHLNGIIRHDGWRLPFHNV